MHSVRIRWRPSDSIRRATPRASPTRTARDDQAAGPGTRTHLHLRLLAQRAGINVNKFLSVDRQAGFLGIRKRPVLIEAQVNGKLVRFPVLLHERVLGEWARRTDIERILILYPPLRGRANATRNAE